MPHLLKRFWLCRSQRCRLPVTNPSFNLFGTRTDSSQILK
jgi:hypothetical protein